MVLSLDLRKRVLAAYKPGATTRRQVAGRFMISLGMVKKIIQQKKNLGHVENLYSRVGRKRSFTEAQTARLEKLVAKNPGMTLEEMREALGVKCALATIHRELLRLQLTYKKKPEGKGAGTRGRA
ncbi:hypothetical protein BH09SUM1_BH09SUM1_27930 [soil metagenome]